MSASRILPHPIAEREAFRIFLAEVWRHGFTFTSLHSELLRMVPAWQVMSTDGRKDYMQARVACSALLTAYKRPEAYPVIDVLFDTVMSIHGCISSDEREAIKHALRRDDALSDKLGERMLHIYADMRSIVPWAFDGCDWPTIPF